MFKRSLAIIVSIFLLARPASAHLLSYSVFDFEPSDDGLTLVVGIQPELALTVMGFAHDTLESLDQFHGQLPLIEAFVESHVAITQSGEDCDWHPKIDEIRGDLLEQQAEGFTIRGILSCPNPDEPFTLETDLFVEAHENQKNLIRYHEGGDAYRVIAELDATTRSTVVDPSFNEEPESTEQVAANDVSDEGGYAPPLSFIVLLAFIVGVGCILWIRRNNNGK